MDMLVLLVMGESYIKITQRMDMLVLLVMGESCVKITRSNNGHAGFVSNG